MMMESSNSPVLDVSKDTLPSRMDVKSVISRTVSDAEFHWEQMMLLCSRAEDVRKDMRL